MIKQFKTIPECIYGSPCKLVCVNPGCRKPGFICESGMQNKEECALFHENCQKMKWSEIENILYDNPNTKIPEFSNFQDDMELFFSNMLKKLKEEHVKFKIWSRTYGYSEELMYFIHMINNGNFNQISGVYMNQVLSEIFTKEKKKIQASFNLDDIAKLQESFNNLVSKIPKIYKFPEGTKPTSSDLLKSEEYTKNEELDSKITTEFDYIRSLFIKSRPKTFKLLYRASDCEFSVNEFHNRCDNMPNTLLLVKTEYGKTIGGYTPLAWNSSAKHWAADKSLTSFLFSLDLKERFQLNLMQFAIACNPEKGPIFGCDDICIVDKSNVEKCNSEFPISYNNFKYSRSNETSVAFTGSLKGEFCTKEWEVFHVEFEEERE